MAIAQECSNNVIEANRLKKELQVLVQIHKWKQPNCVSKCPFHSDMHTLILLLKWPSAGINAVPPNGASRHGDKGYAGSQAVHTVC